VACGADDRGYMRFYVVPYCYRSHFPLAYKSHLPHDVLLLCPDCQIPAQRSSQMRQAKLEAPFSVGVSAQKYRTDPRIRRLRKMASALQSRSNLPPRVREEYSAEICAFLRLTSDNGELSPQNLQNVLDMDEKVVNRDYVSASDQLVRCLLEVQSPERSETDGSHNASLPQDEPFCQCIERFVRDWRLHFVTSMQPRYLPRGWSIDHPVRCDV
jgi:cation-transporting P-type ATPase D